ncbi:MAG: hemolysin family protein [Adhaeribacter sp.]
MEIFILFVLTLLNGFFALAEVAIISAKKSRVEQKALEGSHQARTLLELMRNPEGFLSAVQVGITLIGIISGAYGGAALSDDMQAVLQDIPGLGAYAEPLALVLVIGAITYFSIVIGELIPKTLAIGHAEGIALTVAPLILVFTRLAMPLVKLLSVSTRAVIGLLGIRQPAEETISEEELRHIIKTAGKQGVLDKEESQLHQNIFAYTGQKARDLFTHRLQVEWINVEYPLEDIRRQVQQSPHSKFPVGQGSFDQVAGILTARDFYEMVLAGQSDLQPIIKPPIFVSENMYAHAILNLFKKHKQYLAIVVDEFGSPEGIITLRDILEAIVGDLPDQYESREPQVVIREDHSYLVNGTITIYDLNRELQTEVLERGTAQYATLAGFIIHQLGHLPRTGEQVAHRGYLFEVVDMDGKKIDKVLVRKQVASGANTPDALPG